MELIPVETPAERRLFHQVTEVIYRNVPDWLPYLPQDIESLFSARNPLVRAGGRFRRWVALEGGRPAGRIAAFTFPNRPAVGGIGFWETTDNPAANHLLFEAAEQWLRSEGRREVEAPINFGTRGSYWGLLLEHRTPPTFQENFHPPYYRQLIELEGYSERFRQLTYQISKSTFNADRLVRVAEGLRRRGHAFEYRPFSFRRVDEYAEAAARIYNEGWRHLEGFMPVTADEARQLLAKIRLIVIPDLIWFAFDGDRPIGYIVMIPDFNEYLRRIGGRLRWWNQWLLPFLFRWYTPPRLKGLVFGVVPDYHNKGVDVMLVYHFYRAVMRYPRIRTAELAWVGSFNPRMQRFMDNIGCTVAKVHATYGKVLST